MTKLRILFSGGGGVGNEALWQLLGDRYECFFGDADPTAVDPVIPAERVFRLPFANDPTFPDQIASLAGDLGLNLFVPGVDEELYRLKEIAALRPDLTLLAPPDAFIRSMLDKAEMARCLASKGLAVPVTMAAEDRDDLAFPYILKPRSGRGSRAVRKVTGEDEARAHLILEAGAGPFIAQEALEGTEFTVCMAADRAGVLKAIVPVEVGMKKGVTIRARCHDVAAVRSACQIIHAAWPVGGCYNIQGMLSPDRGFLPFEINPRISTTFCLVIKAGVDPIALFFGNGLDDGTTTGDGSLAPFSPVTLKRHMTNHFQ
ncbi:MAG: ATP-grasp domain-containing protein [Rhodospirillales bacterium]